MAQFLGVPGPSQDEFNALSGHVTTHDFGSLTVDAFKSALTAFVDSSMAQNELRPIRVAISTAADVFAQTIYVGWVSKNGESSTRTAVDLHAVSASDVVKRHVTGELYNTTWHFDNLALNSNLTNVPSVVNLSTNLSIDYADAETIGYRTTESTKVDIRNLQGFPTGKTIVCAYPRGYDDIYGAYLWVDNSLYLRGTSKTSRTISVTITVFYK